MKNSNGTIGNRTRDLPVVAQCLNKLRHRILMWCTQKNGLDLGSGFAGGSTTSTNTRYNLVKSKLRLRAVVSCDGQ
jgi:hypothetical protein